jgi:hypothetical protein
LSFSQIARHYLLNQEAVIKWNEIARVKLRKGIKIYIHEFVFLNP